MSLGVQPIKSKDQNFLNTTWYVQPATRIPFRFMLLKLHLRQHARSKIKEECKHRKKKKKRERRNQQQPSNTVKQGQGQRDSRSSVYHRKNMILLAFKSKQKEETKFSEATRFILYLPFSKHLRKQRQ